jgi:hypothetical protein
VTNLSDVASYTWKKKTIDTLLVAAGGRFKKIELALFITDTILFRRLLFILRLDVMIGRLPNDMVAKKEMNDHFFLRAILFLRGLIRKNGITDITNINLNSPAVAKFSKSKMAQQGNSTFSITHTPHSKRRHSGDDEQH